MMPISSIDILFVSWLQKFVLLKTFFQVITFFGSEFFFLLILPFYYWFIDRKNGIHLALFLIQIFFVCTIAKFIFHSPRPFWTTNAIVPLSSESSYGFPSTHSAIAFSLWPFLALIYRKKWLVGLSIFFMVFIPISRLFLGLHSMVDVFGGILIGFIGLIGYFTYEKKWWDHYFEFSSTKQIRINVSFLIICFLVILFVIFFTKQYQDPAIWKLASARVSIEYKPLDPKQLLAPFGLLCGLLFSLVIGKRSMEDSIPKTIKSILISYCIGITGLLLLYIGLKFLFPKGADWIRLSFYSIRYALLGLWTIWLAPVLFKR